MNKFFSDLTKRNWGFTYHVILADFGQVVSVILLSLIFAWTGINKYAQFQLLGTIIIGAFVIMAIGYWYECKQSRQDWSNKEEVKEDMLANFVGVILGSLKVWGASLI
jgi:Na+/melibiose symporter-like transporter